MAIGLAVAGVFAQSAAGIVNLTAYLEPLRHDYLVASGAWNDEYAYITNNARWRGYPDGPIAWQLSGYTFPDAPDNSTQTVHFLRVKDYYAPASSNQPVGMGVYVTYPYAPYSNTLTMVMEGIGSGANAVWRFPSSLAYPSELTNASAFKGAYTNTSGALYTLKLEKLPDGIYTAAFNSVRDCYTPPNRSMDLDGSPRDFTQTVAYLAYSNSLFISTEDENANPISATWSIVSFPAEFTNSTAYINQGTNGSAYEEYTPVPTGTYAVAYHDMAGFISPVPSVQTVNVEGASSGDFVGVYTQLYGNLQINILPAGASNATWQITVAPENYTNLTFGTGTYMIANVPAGDYTVVFQDLPGWSTPVPASGAVSVGATRTLSGTYTFISYNLTVNLGPPFASQQNLAGRGSGYAVIETDLNTYSQAVNTVVTYPVPRNTRVSITAYPDSPGGTDIDSFVYKWYRGNNGYPSESSWPPQPFVTNLAFDMTGTHFVWLLFSEEYKWFDNVGDIDNDGLPDEWEIAQFGDELYGGPAEDAALDSGYGYFSNPDGDFIPSASPVPPATAVLVDNIWSYAGSGIPGYPRTDLLTRGTVSIVPPPYTSLGLGYASGMPFYNFLECRGLDGYYRNNVDPASGLVYTNRPGESIIYGDDPRTDPDVGMGSPPPGRDTDGDTMSDGWEYYFWYWRSADAYAIGITNSANLSWVASPDDEVNSNISPIRPPQRDEDTDLDGLHDVIEFQYGTDPTHADTDSDGMDDDWEIRYFGISNALYFANGSLNPDGDYYATVLNQFVLAPGMAGTAFADPVCYSGTDVNPAGAWVDVYTNNGANVFDLFQDTILKASGALTNRQAADGAYPDGTVYYGTNAATGAFQQGYPAWVDVNTDGIYDTDDIALVNPPIKHDAVYCMAPVPEYPGVCSFNPRTAWTNLVATGTNEAPTAATNTAPYTTYQEYLGGDYVGRLSWDAGGRATVQNDSDFVEGVARSRTSYTLPTDQDTDSDQIPDGWELYVGLNPNNAADAGLDPDDDKLNNAGEWANVAHPLGSSAAWPNKPWPTDPGAITAPSPNDPHPKDTDWDGLTDAEERTNNSNPTSWDTDSDHLPDGWEFYAGTSITNADAMADPDADGLMNWQEYWTGTVPEWQLVNPAWGAVYFCVRQAMPWDPVQMDPATDTLFIPPDYLTDPTFMYVNGVYTDLEWLRTNYPAASDGLLVSKCLYHTTLASGTNAWDSDGDNMDDYWEVYHGLNPLRGLLCRVIQDADGGVGFSHVALPDANPAAPGYQFGLQGAPFNSLAEYIAYFQSIGSNRYDLMNVVGPFNLGLFGMDPDGDNLPNLYEYSFTSNRPFYHTDPTPVWRTDQHDENSFVCRNYGFDLAPGIYFTDWSSPYVEGIGGGAIGASPFFFEQTEGYDTDNDGVGDYAEINSAAGQPGNNPLDERNPIRNRALYFNGSKDFARQLDSRASYDEARLTRFCVEAWIKPDNPLLAANQVIVEKAGLYSDPQNIGGGYVVGANFRMGIINGLPYVLYHGAGTMRTFEARARASHRITSSAVWTHIAGSYDGTNLIVYVNGEVAYSLRTTEVPVNGYNVLLENGMILGTRHTIMAGARDNYAGLEFPPSDPAPADYFAGCIDEVRVWNGARTRAEILANKDRRLTQADITANMTAIHNYFSIDDVPDPNAGESIFPAGMNLIDANMHPAIAWWRDYAMRSTVYSGVANSYNYMVYAGDHAWHSRPRTPAMDDYYHFTSGTNGATNALSAPPGYVNPANPYHEIDDFFMNRSYDLLLFNGARAVATNSWLDGLTPDPDSTDSDGDGLPDWWEQMHNLDPNDPTGENGAWGDPDYDGLNNRAEYLAGTNPRDPDTNGTGVGDYDYPRGAYSRTYGEMYTDGDGMPDEWESQNGLDPLIYDANLDLDGDGWSNYQEFLAGTDPNDAASHPQPVVSGTVHYYGTNVGRSLSSIRVFAHPGTNLFDDPRPFPGAQCDSAGNFTISGLPGGEFVLFAFMDLNGDGIWNCRQENQVAICEPAGLGEANPYFLNGSDIASGIRVGVSDFQPGYGRALWATFTTNSPNYNYNLIVNRLSQQGGPVVLQKSNKLAPDLSEFHFQAAGIYGLTAGAYQWWALNGPSNVSGVFHVNWPATVIQPTLLYPRGDSLYYARVLLNWNMDFYSTLYRLQLAQRAANGSLTTVADGYHPVPYRDNDGTYRDYLPFYVSDLANGAYYWRIAGWNPQTESAWSDWQTFNVNLSSTNSRWISGDIYYYGKAPATRIIVEAYDNSAFSGEPAARHTLTPPASTGWIKCSYTLRGLRQGAYYVRAFLDVAPLGGAGPSGALQAWSSDGFYRDPEAFYQPGVVNLTAQQFLNGIEVIIRDKDTDNDALPDAWEMYYFGNLDQTGDMDYDDDGETNLQEYIKDGVNQNPTAWDTDHDGLADGFESQYNGAVFGFAANAPKVAAALNANMWDTDGDGYSDGAELLRYRTDPLNPASFPSYRPLCMDAWPSPGDFDGDGRSDLVVYDFNAGVWRLLTMALQAYEWPFGLAQAQPMVSDYDGDGRADFSFYDQGIWTIYFSQTGVSASRGFGDAAMTPVPGDYDGDGRADLAVYNANAATWYIYNMWNGQVIAGRFGAPGTIPVPGDYNGDGATDFAVYEPAAGVWTIGWVHKYYQTWNVISGGLGGPSWIPVPGDYDGDGRNDVCLYEEASGTWMLYTMAGQFAQGGFGGPGWIPVPGDYDGDGRTDLAIHSASSGMWRIFSWSGAYYEGGFGGPGAVPILQGR